ncbi:hypothetical protein LZ198_33060 [Myxococcus sp. K15C18031901]|uniref:hypothetical protein n=1 Tax=Myxococcus dinghuensis TaxID=2906761 RepID=UPI0020A6F830|nr:hypothetical protein [Myxococcus dinghuensis]MCP3103724.1 hypothetical protein [Myxococcus dinghuensis]
MKTFNRRLTQSVAALALLGALPAAAGTATYSGSLCTSVSGFSAPTIFRSGRLLNQTANTIEVVCPLQRNVSTSFTEDSSFAAYVIDAHLTENVCCVATVAEADGTAITSGSACTTGADTANIKGISINLASVFASVNGYLSLRCVIPGQYTDTSGAKFSSVLSSFTVVE